MIGRNSHRCTAAPSEANCRRRKAHLGGRRPLRWTSLAVTAISVAAMVFTNANSATASFLPCWANCTPPSTPAPQPVVSENWAKRSPFLAVGVPCTLGSGPEKALDGAASNIYTDKWCELSGQRRLLIDIPADSPYTNGFALCGVDIQKIVIKHAGVAENPIYNTRAFRVRTLSQLTGTWSEYKTVTNNTANITQIDPSNAPNLAYGHIQQVELTIDAATQSASQVVRIYEVEVWATASGWNTQFLCPGVTIPHLL